MRRLLTLLLLVLAAIGASAQPKAGRHFSEELLRALHGLRTDSIDITLQLQPLASPPAGRVVASYSPANIYMLRMAAADAQGLEGLPGLVFAGLAHPPSEELTTGFLDLTLNRINTAHARFPSLLGDSVRVSVKEQSFDTADIDLKGRTFASGLASNTQSAHATIMATIIAGAGNSSPFALGVAPAALLTSVTFASLLPESDTFYRNRGITVQNHSYGTVVESFYGPEAAAYDAAARNNPSLQFVFSSGNSGTANASGGTYAGLPASNLTGNFKHAKNVLVVGATDSLGVLEAASSRGPAHDGRVKPELTAFGQDGSSGASALVSGSVALVQQAYRRQNGVVPMSALVRAVLVNSADDAGNAQVDFKYGFGLLNIEAALRTVLESRYAIDSVAAGAARTRSITIPGGIRQLKVTLAWTDLPAAAGSSRALVNDLDGVITGPAGAVKPWVLAIAPASINNAASRGTDTLNNIEQITIDNPAAGNYSVEITGTRVTGTQVFALAWQLDSADRFEWTFPVSGDVLRAGERNVLRWNSNRVAAGTIEYQLNGGSWLPVASGADLLRRYIPWQAPDTFTTARFRVRTPGFPDAVSGAVALGKAPDLTTGFNCADSFLLLWNRQPVASWQLYELGDRYLTPFRITTDTAALLRKQDHPSLYYAVAPLIGGVPGPRSYTLKYDAQGVECYVRNFYLSGQDGNTAQFEVGVGTLLGLQSVTLQRLGANGFADRAQVIPATTQFAISDTGLHEGINRYRLRIRLANGADVYSGEVPVYYFGNNPVLVFPNPAGSGQPVSILAKEAGRYLVQVVDGGGRVLYTRRLDALNSPIAPLTLPAGFYLVRIIDRDTVLRVQKLVIL